MDKFPTLYTKRLRLIEIDHSYDEALYAILSNDAVMKYYGRSSMAELEEAISLVNHFQDIFQTGRGMRWGIIWKETDLFIGTVGIHNVVSEMKRAEVGFELHPDYWRMGIMAEALNSVLEYCFSELGLYRVGAITFPENDASNLLLNKVGFKQEGILRGYLFQDGKSHDANVLSMVKPEWIRKKREADAPVAYTDYMTEIIKRSEAAGDFDNLPGKGKPLNLGPMNSSNSYEAQLNKTLKDNHILPRWVELANEIDKLKGNLQDLEGKEKRKLVKEINKKVKEYNYACPPSLQRNKVSE